MKLWCLNIGEMTASIKHSSGRQLWKVFYRDYISLCHSNRLKPTLCFSNTRRLSWLIKSSQTIVSHNLWQSDTTNKIIDPLQTCNNNTIPETSKYLGFWIVWKQRSKCCTTSTSGSSSANHEPRAFIAMNRINMWCKVKPDTNLFLWLSLDQS